MDDGPRSFFSELKRRKVTHVAIIYAAFAAGAIGVVADGGPNIGMSSGLITAVIWGVILGYPVALALAWFLKLGLEDPAPSVEAGHTSNSRTLPETDSSNPTIPGKGIHIQTLGGIRIFKDGQEITSLPKQPVRCALLAYVAVEKNPPKEKALGLLWPDKDPELARKSLNQTLTELQKDLGDDWVDSKGQFLVLREDISTDLGPFQTAVRQSEWERAISYYEGRFLDGFYLPGAYDFGEWQEQIGGSVSLGQRKANTRLIEAKYKEGDLSGALTLAKSWSDRAPLDDGAQNWFVRLLAETGQRGAALKHAENFIDRLKRDDDEPLDETVRLIEEIKSGVVGAGETPSPPIPLDPDSRPRHGPEPVPPDHWFDLFIRKAKAHYLKLLFAGVGIFAIWTFFGPPSVRLEPNRIVCFPPTIGGTFEVQTQDVCQAIQIALEQAEPLIFQAGQPHLTQEQRGNSDALSVSQAREIAFGQGAGYFILPSLTAEGDSLFVTLGLYESHEGRWLLSGMGSGTLSSASSGQIAVRAMPEIFSEVLDPGREVDLDFLTHANPASVGPLIRAEGYYRKLQFDSAVLNFREAVAKDSLAAYPAIKGALAATWLGRRDEASELIEIALANSSRLPRKYEEFTKGLWAFFHGQADTAIAYYETAIRLDEDWSEAWVGLGEVYYHLFPRGMDIPESAERAFREAHRLDRDFLPPLLYLAEIELRKGDTAQARRIVDQISLANPDSSVLLKLQTEIACVRHPISDDRWEVLAGVDPDVVFLAGWDLAVGLAHPTCAEGAYAALHRVQPQRGQSYYSFAVLKTLSGLLIAQGRGREAASLLRQAQASGQARAVPFLYLIQGTVEPAFDSLAKDVSELAPQIFQRGFRPQEGLAFATWHASKGHLKELRALSASFDTLASSDTANAVDKGLAMAVRGHLALTEGDSTQALELFSGMNLEVPFERLAEGHYEALPFEHLRLAELLLGAGQYPQAHRAAEIFDHPIPSIFLAFIPRSLVVRYNAAQAMGWDDAAEEYLERLKRLGQEDLLNGVSRDHSP